MFVCVNGKDRHNFISFQEQFDFAAAVQEAAGCGKTCKKNGLGGEGVAEEERRAGKSCSQ